MNDPAGIALMIGMIELATHDDATLLVVGREFVVEMVVGAAFGLVGGRLLVPLLAPRAPAQRKPVPGPRAQCSRASSTASRRSRTARGSWRSSSLAWPSATPALPYKAEIERFHGSLAGLAEVVVFVALGATVRLSELGARDWLEGVVLVVGAGRRDPAARGRGDARWRPHEPGREGVHRLQRAQGRGAGPARGVRDPRRRAGRGAHLRPRLRRRARVGGRARDRSCRSSPGDSASRCACRTGCRGSSRCGSAASRPGHASTASRPAPPPTGWRSATCRSANDAWVTLLVRDGDALQPDSERGWQDDRVLILADPERSHDLNPTFTA